MAKKQTFSYPALLVFGKNLFVAPIVLVVVLTIVLIISAVYLVSDYRRHKKPLVEADPNARYTLTHHVRLVTLPLIWYRLSFSLHNKHGKGLVRKF